MANTLEAKILDILNDARDDIRANMEREHVNASGRTSASIRVEKKDGHLFLIGGNNKTHGVAGAQGIQAPDTAPIPTLEIGRKGGGNPPVPRGFYYIIREWTRVKGISFFNESERNTFSFFLSRKIAREGTMRNKTHINIYSEPVNKAKIKISDAIKSEFGNSIRAALSSVSNLKGAFTE